MTKGIHCLTVMAVLLIDTACAGRMAESASADAGPAQYTIEEFMDVTSIRGASFSPDGSRVLYSSDETGVFSLYSIPVTGGEPTALESSTTESTYAVSWFPKDERILFTRDEGGNELYHVYVLSPDGQVRDLTSGENIKAWFVDWSADGSAFYIGSNERDPGSTDIWRYDSDTYERTLFFSNVGGYLVRGISDDGKWVSLVKSKSMSASDLYLWNSQTRKVTRLSPEDAVASWSPTAFDPGSSWLYYLTNEGSEFTRLRRYDLREGRHEDVEEADWDILYTSFSPSGRYRVTGTNEDGRVAIKVLDTELGGTVDLPAVPAGEIGNIVFSRSETHMAFHAEGDRTPANLYTHKLGSGELVQLTDTLSSEIDARDLVDSEVIRFESFDGLPIPALLYKPQRTNEEKPAPAVIWVHGGPGGQTRPGYNALRQLLVNHGYVVLGINNRGSSGYGRTFFMADDRKHGREPLWDCIEGRDYLASLPYVDADRIGIMGASYGGYMVLAALAFEPDAFDVGVDIFGVSNWVRTLESIPPWWEAYRDTLYAEIGDPATQKDMLRATSPLFHAGNIRKPLLVLQGANDPRVLKEESDDIVAAVRDNGVLAEYLVFEDEGHGFRKKKNRIEGYGTILRFLDRHLKAAGE